MADKRILEPKKYDKLLNDKEASEYLGISKQTLCNWRHLGKGPAYYKMSEGPRGRVRYSILDLEKYRDACRVVPFLTSINE